MLWVVFALVLFCAMAAEIQFQDLNDGSITYRWCEVIVLPYTLRPKQCQVGLKEDLHGIRIIWEMPRAYGLQSWLAYKTTVEIAAVGIYFYGAVVFLSVLFLGAISALEHICLMVGLCMVLRIITALF